MKKLVVAALLIPSLASGAWWDETNPNPDPSDTVMINDTSQPEGSKTQYTAFGNFPVSTDTQAELNSKVGTSGDETVGGVKTFTSSPVVPEPITDSQAATKYYVDNNGGGGGGIPEAPSDGAAYGRAVEAWEPVQKTADVDVVEEGLSLTMDRTPAGTDADPWILNVKGALTAAADQYFGTNAGSTLGFYDLPEGGSGGSGYVATPTYSNETCTTGQRSFDDSYIYICEATDQWDRYAVTWLGWSNPAPGGCSTYAVSETINSDVGTNAVKLASSTARTNVGFWFRTTTATDMVRLTVKLKEWGTATGDLTVYLYSATDQNATAAGSPSTLLGTSTTTLDASTVAITLTEYDFDFESITLATGTNYWVIFESDTVLDTDNNIQINADTTGGRQSTSEDRSSWSYAGANHVWMEISECND